MSRIVFRTSIMGEIDMPASRKAMGKRLFDPIKIGKVEIKNRIVMTPFALASAEDTTKIGVMHQKYIDFFEERAKGGVGLIIPPDTVIDRSLRFQCHLCLDGDEYNPGLSALTEAVHMWGAKIAANLVHNGYRFAAEWQTSHPQGKGYRPLSSSALHFEDHISREMNTEEIEWVEDCYVNAAARAVTVGFDAIHLAGHHGFLIAQFMSPRFNKRTDKYGGSFENRMRFACELIEKIKAKIGTAVPIIFGLAADELIEGGLTIKDTKIIAKYLEQLGIAMFNISVGLDHPDRYHLNHLPMGSPQCPFVEQAAEIKKVVNIPVIIGGRITQASFAEDIISQGKADMVAMTRQLVADPAWPIKVAAGRSNEIIPCIGCNVCLERLLARKVSRCAVNAALGREKEFAITPTNRPVSVMVVGGGPAGMEAALVSALRGHRVSLYEEHDTLGGQLSLSMRLPYKNEIRQFRDYLVRRLEKLDIDIRLNTKVTPVIVEETAPDVIIIATGASPYVPEIAGVDWHNVMTAWDVLSGKIVKGNRVVMAGGGMVGCETAEHLLQQGKKITIIEMLPEIALDAEKTNRSALMERFRGYNCEIMVNVTVKFITSQGVMVIQNGHDRSVAGDTVVIAMGAVANDTLAKQLHDKVKNLHIIGDSFRPGRIVDAINHASYIARQI